MDKELRLHVGTEHPASRVSVWEDVLQTNFFALECKADAAHLRASIDGRIVEGGSVLRSAISRQVLTRTRSSIKKSDPETAIIAVVTDGLFAIEQDDRVSMLTEGDVCIVDGSRPFEAVFASELVRHGLLQVPKSAVTRRVGSLDGDAFGPFRGGGPLQKMVAAFLIGMTDALYVLDARTLSLLLDQALDLLALAIAEQQRGSIDPSTHRVAMLQRIKGYIKTNLGDADLTIERAASALGISSRYINALLSEGEATSFGRYLLAQRLEGARREIMDPRHRHRQVTEVAFEWGFKNTSHFGRVYKDRFGMTPRDAKGVGHGLENRY